MRKLKWEDEKMKIMIIFANEKKEKRRYDSVEF